MAFLVDDVPLTEVLCRTEFITAGEQRGGFEPCYLVGVTSIPGYVPMFQAHFGCGGLYHRLPFHAFCMAPCEPLALGVLALWDSFSYDVSVHAYQHLDGLRVLVRCGDGETRPGQYLFTLDWADVSRQAAYAELADQHKCFGAGSLVLTERGLMPIEDVTVGDSVLTHLGRWRPVTALHHRTGQAIKVRSQAHPGIITTQEHRFLGPNGWTEAGSVTHVAQPAKVEGIPVPSCPVSLTPELCRMIGMWLGDGCVNMAKGADGHSVERVQISVGPRNVEKAAEAIGNAGFNPKSYAVGSSGVRTFVVYGKPFCRWLRQNFGRYSHGKKLPSWVYGLPEIMREQLLQGYLETDGWLNGKRWELTTVSKDLALGAKLLGQTLGYSTALYFSSRSNDVIEGRRVTARPAWKLKLRRWQPGLKIQNYFDTDERFYAPVRGITELSEKIDLYDLTVKEDHSYVVEGLVAHNCSHILALDSGHIAAMPNNRVLFRESSWVKPAVPKHWRVQPRYYSVERDVSVEDGDVWAYRMEDEAE